jgi:hypothetical protein
VPLKLTELNSSHGMGKARRIRVPLSVYAEYCNHNRVEHPHYAFGDDFGDERAAFLDDYTSPELFPRADDLLEVSSRARLHFEKFRYMIIGGARTGTNLHVDPKCTCAWNTSLCGRKRWVLFPPTTHAATLEEMGVETDLVSRSSLSPPLHWWQDVYSRLKRSGRAVSLGMKEYIQGPGETIFVPAGWWHTVINLDFSVAITENLLLAPQLPFVWSQLSSRWPHFAGRLAWEICESKAHSALLEADTVPESTKELIRQAAHNFDPTLEADDGAGTVEFNHLSLNSTGASKFPGQSSGSKRLLFFSVDGVLRPSSLELSDRTAEETADEAGRSDGSSSRTEFVFDVACVANLRRVVASTDAELVLTSSLRVWEATRQAVQSALNKHGLGFGRFTTVCAAAAQHSDCDPSRLSVACLAPRSAARRGVSAALCCDAGRCMRAASSAGPSRSSSLCATTRRSAAWDSGQWSTRPTSPPASQCSCCCLASAACARTRATA